MVKVIRHERYDGRTLKNDIALLKLEKPLEFNEFVQPAKLPHQEQETSGDCIVSGWGATSYQGPLSDTLQKVDVPVIDDDECLGYYAWYHIYDSNICAGYKEGGKDSCNGDSGGPLYCKGHLTGIVSWGYQCARPEYPGVYTQVSYFIDWIRNNTQ